MAGHRAETAELVPMPNDAHIKVVRVGVGVAATADEMKTKNPNREGYNE